MASNAVRSQRNSSVRHGEPNRGLATEKGSNAEARDGDVRGDSNKTREVAVGLFQSAAGAWVLIIALIFGGCCR